MSENTPNDSVSPEELPAPPPGDGGAGPLSYESSDIRPTRPPQPHILVRIAAMTFGFSAAGAGVLFLSVFVFLMVDGVQSNHGVPNKIAGGIYVLGFVGCVFLVAHFVRNAPEWTGTKWLVLGGLIGLGVSMLVEGICFSVN